MISLSSDFVPFLFKPGKSAAEAHTQTLLFFIVGDNCGLRLIILLKNLRSQFAMTEEVIQNGIISDS